jgi:hypothetical protein
MIQHPHRPRRTLAAAAGLVLALGCVTACGDDDDNTPDVESPSGTTMPFVGGTGGETLDSTGGPGGTVLNNQPTNPAVNNAPPGDDGTG